MGDLNNGHHATFPQALKRGSRGSAISTPPLPTPFDYDFRTLVIPDLHLGAQRLAPFVAKGLIGFDEAADTLHSMAVQRGATYLSDDSDFFLCLSIYLSDRCEEARAREDAP